MKASRIDIDLLDDSLKKLIGTSTKIFPIATFEDLPTTLEQDYYRVVSGEHRNEIYTWDAESATYVLIGADDKEISWNDLSDVPVAFNPATHSHSELHTHTNKSVLDKVQERHLEGYTKSEADVLLNGKSASNHTHSQLHTHANKSALDLLSSEHIGMIESASERIQNIESGYSDGHMHTNSDTLNKLRYSGTSALVDLNVLDGLEFRFSTKADASTLDGHVNNTSAHVTSSEKLNWNEHVNNTSAHVTSSEKLNWNEHTYLTNNPHAVTKDQVGLGSVRDYGLANEISARAGTSHAVYMTPLRTAQAIESLHANNTDIHVSAEDRLRWDSGGDVHTHSNLADLEKLRYSGTSSLVDLNVLDNLESRFSSKVDTSTFTGHANNANVHVTLLDKQNWNRLGLTVGETQPASGMWYKVVG